MLERGGFSPIPFFYVMGGSLVFVFLTWHIPSVAGSMMAGAVSLSLADAVYPAIWGSRAAGAGLIAAGAVGGATIAAGRWGVDRLRVSTSLHTGNGQVVAVQPTAASVSTASPPNTDQLRSSAGTERNRARTSAPASGARDSAARSKDPTTPSTERETNSTTEDAHPSS